MEFHITMPSPMDPRAIEQTIREVDPAGLVDIDPSGRTLRVSASVDVVQLIVLLNQAGYPMRRDQVAQAASICCGGCSG